MEPSHAYPHIDPCHLLAKITDPPNSKAKHGTINADILKSLETEMSSVPFSKDRLNFSNFMQATIDEKMYSQPKNPLRQISLLKPNKLNLSKKTEMNIPCPMSLEPNPKIKVKTPPAPFKILDSIVIFKYGGGSGYGGGSSYGGYGGGGGGGGFGGGGGGGFGGGGSGGGGGRYRKGAIPGEHVRYKDKDLQKRQRREFKILSKKRDKDGKIDFRRKGKRYRFVQRKKDKNEDVEKDSAELAAITPIMQLPKQKNVDNDSF